MPARSTRKSTNKKASDATKSNSAPRSANGNKSLVVVESPTKARTLSRILGPSYVIKASMGHVRDLPTGSLGIDIEKGFAPTYVTLKGKSPVIKELKELGDQASAIYLATDPDREGEAISWHLLQAANWKDLPVYRVAFHEITRDAVQEAFKNPRGIDMHLVDAQQARRVLDRLVGYQLSPLLWRKVQRGLSAGRVQSVALRLVVEREEEIEAFRPQEYWTIEATLQKARDGDSGTFVAVLYSLKGVKEKLEIPDQASAQGILDALDGADYSVDSVKRREVRQNPPPPFITSTLQQEAWRKLRFSAKKTMFLAQQLYEGVNLGDQGSVGLITYMRTDSTHVAASAIQETRQYIQKRYGQQYLPREARVFTKKVAGAQEAHEAIRPTSTMRDPDSVKPYLSSDQHRLYSLIWSRMVASQMAQAVSDATTVDVEARPPRGEKSYIFRATGSVLKFPGFRILYLEGRDDEAEEKGGPLPPLAQGDPLRCLGLDPQQHFTQPPPRYTEATLIKALEEKGIGRPSTYAPILSTIQERGYVVKEEGRFKPTLLGRTVCKLLVQFFPSLINVDFTARMEEYLDEIARGEKQWVPIIQEFYQPFSRILERALEEAPRMKVEEATEEVCEQCGRPMVIKTGRFGRFLACSGFPQCRNTKPLLKATGAECPQCGGNLVERRGKKRGRVFYGCSNYPACNFMVTQRPLPQRCPQCGGLLVASGRGRAKCTNCPWTGEVPEEEAVAAEV